MLKSIAIIVLLTLSLLVVVGQSILSDDPVVLASQVSVPVPIVFAKKGDGLPEKMKLQGTIVDLTFDQAGCGIIAWSGTLQVKLTEPIAGYPYDDVFLVLPCFPDFEKFKADKALYVNRRVSLEVSKFYPEYRFGLIKDMKSVPCAYELITNKLDSKKTPFYCTQENISESIEAVENKQREKQ